MFVSGLFFCLLFMQSEHFVTENTKAEEDAQNVPLCIFPATGHQMHMLSFPPELRSPVGAMRMYPEEPGVCRFISEAQPRAAQPSPPHIAQG